MKDRRMNDSDHSLGKRMTMEDNTVGDVYGGFDQVVSVLFVRGRYGYVENFM